MRSSRAWPLSLALVLGGACVTERTSDPPHLEDPGVLSLAPREAWTVELRGRTVGSVIRFQETAAQARTLFAVRNVHGQDLGTIDSNGRAWRMRPHREPEALGAGTVLEGVRLILGLEDVPELVPAALEGLQQGG